MFEIALQIVLNLFIALIIGILIGYIIGKGRSSKEETNKDKKLAVQKPVKDNLKKIKGIDSKFEFELNRMGINSFKQISEWTNEDCVTIGASINAENSIEEFSWVEQAKILASGEETIYSQKVENKEINVA
ncbi:hypothetical protein AFAEC_2234 [Aliarcobacter faecis]|uniref:hypothetical protein n=1 Tax=Aliarcobacter faecis TaxID=1564138 RepID=UPI00047C3665|nr:hypothetical protein [Aliarcobacter faecis]QKF74377.1 hypothetical protein AFAEC_2234 [Aliarcobacter faecis]